MACWVFLLFRQYQFVVARQLQAVFGALVFKNDEAVFAKKRADIEPLRVDQILALPFDDCLCLLISHLRSQPPETGTRGPF